ncbi:MAG TPA: hypothetical protein PLL10_07680, partial [Elusimicrobiales bacterium]|nr:hypothetical protein [Elusimicrobiales bacterium]
MALLKGFLLFADDFVRSPWEAAGKAAARPSAAAGFAGYALGALSSALYMQLLWGEGGLGSTLNLAVFILILNLLLALFYSGLSNLFLELLGAHGHAYGLFVIFGLAEGVKALLIPGSLVLLAFAAPGLDVLLLLVVLVAEFICALKLIEQIYQVRKPQAFLALVSPSLFAAGLVFLSLS